MQSVALKETGVFDVVHGVLVGKPQDEAYYEAYKSILTKVIDNERLPVVYNVNFGHATPRCVLQYGAMAKVDMRRLLVMQISSRFTLAVHIFACIDTFKDDYKVTSEFLAGSTNVNPVIVRKILGQLKAAGLVEVARGSGGASIAKPLNEITFLDIYRAVECVEGGELFHFHDNPNPNCPVGKNIHKILDEKLQRVQEAMERELASITLADVHEDAQKYIQM